MTLYLIFILTTLCLLFWFLHRNRQVSKYRGQVLDRISELSDRDIANGSGWKWRYEAYGGVSYDEMLMKFWIPLDKFYEDFDFNVKK